MMRRKKEQLLYSVRNVMRDGDEHSGGGGGLTPCNTVCTARRRSECLDSSSGY